MDALMALQVIGSRIIHDLADEVEKEIARNDAVDQAEIEPKLRAHSGDVRRARHHPLTAALGVMGLAFGRRYGQTAPEGGCCTAVNNTERGFSRRSRMAATFSADRPTSGPTPG